MPRRHDHWAFAAQFEGQWHQMVTGRPHHHSTNLGTAGEQQVVEGKGAEARAYLRAAEYHRHLIGTETGRQQALNQLTGAWRQLGGLDHHPIASRQGGGQGDEGQRDRVVPRRHDADDAFGLILHVGAASTVKRRDVTTFGLHEATQVPQQVIDGLDHAKQFHDVCFVP